MNKKDPFEGKILISPTEVAKLLSVTRATIYNWINSGKLKAARFSPGCVRIPVSELKEFIKKHLYEAK